MKKIRPLFLSAFFIFFVASLFSQPWKLYSDSAKIYSDQKNFTKAIELYNYSRSLLPEDSIYTDSYIQVSKKILSLNYMTGQYGETISQGKHLAAIIAKISTTVNNDYATICNMLGVIYNINGKLDSAKFFYVNAKNIREKLSGNQSSAYAQSCNNLGVLYHDLGEYDSAEPLLLEAKNIREKLTPLNQTDPYAITCVSLANLYRDMGQYDKAESFYLLAKERRGMAGKENPDYSSSCNILADLYSYMGNFDKAEALYIEAKDIREKLDKKSTAYGETCNNLASLYKDIGQYKKAEELALQAKKIYDSLPADHPARAININTLGELYFSMQEYAKAESYFLEARELWAKELGKQHPYYTQNSASLAKIFWNLGDILKANQFYIEAFTAQSNQINKNFQFTNEKEKQLYLKNAIGSSDEYQSFYYKKFNHEDAGQPYNISLLNRNLILSSTQKVRELIYSSGDTNLNRQYNNWINLKETLAVLYTRNGAENLQQIKSTEEKADNIEKELSIKSSAFKDTQKKISWNNIQQSLSKDEAAIEFVAFHFYNGNRWTDSIYYIALILRNDKPAPQLIFMFEKKQLDTVIAAVKNDEDINNLYSNSAASAQLYNIIWKPLEKYLSGIAKIYFAPAGDLFKISFAAISYGNKKLLSDKYRLIQVSTTASVCDKQFASLILPGKIQLYGGINYDADSVTLKQNAYALQEKSKHILSLPKDFSRGGSFQYLPGTNAEVAEIKAEADKFNLQVSVLSGSSATKESFKELNGNKSPSVLHIATHGFFLPDPQSDTRDKIQKKFETTGKAFRESDNPLFRSALLFAGANNTWKGKYFTGIDDGILTAYDVSNMYLPNTKLVVLSACETALGDIEGSEGVYGLQRGFRIAGVQNLVMSLWKVPDTETAEFMQYFYKDMFSKQSISEAFYSAQNFMKNKYRSEPNKWAAWILVK